jgi:hypothetical protein
MPFSNALIRPEMARSSRYFWYARAGRYELGLRVLDIRSRPITTTDVDGAPALATHHH